MTKIESTADNTSITLATHLKGPKGLRLEGARYPTAWEVIFTSREDGSAYHACFVYIELEPDFIDLGATGTAVVEHFATYFNRDNKEPKNRNKLPPGRYTVTAGYDHAEHDQVKPCPYWHGKIVTGAAEIEIVAKTGEAKPAAADWGDAVNGLQTRLTVEKNPVKAGEPIRLRLELRNVGTEVKRVDAQQVAVNNPLHRSRAEGLLPLHH